VFYTAYGQTFILNFLPFSDDFLFIGVYNNWTHLLRSENSEDIYTFHPNLQFLLAQLAMGVNKVLKDLHQKRGFPAKYRAFQNTNASILRDPCDYSIFYQGKKKNSILKSDPIG
jgi:hypothetical protein